MLSLSLQATLTKLCERHEEVEHLLALPETLQDPKRLELLSKEYAQLEPLVQARRLVTSLEKQLADLAVLQKEDPDFAELATQEEQDLKKHLEGAHQGLKLALVPKDPDDEKDCYLEVRAGTGGQEAALFCGVLLRMYLRYVERRGWRYEIVSANESDLGGYKEVVVQIHGQGAYSRLKFESGGHRVQRVPITEAQGRIHTSACTVAVLPAVDEIEDFDINPADLRIDTFRSSGAGGQHVNKTDSAIRITHLPSGIVVECQEDRSQHKNRSKAMSLLKTKLLTSQREKQQQERSSLRQSLVGSGDRSERIRTYNYPQGRLTDHRINLTLYRLEEIVEGELDEVIDPLAHEYQASLLAELEQR